MFRIIKLWYNNLMQKINFLSQGQRVDGVLFIPQNGKKNPGVIFLHGATSNYDSYILRGEQLLEKGIASLAISFRGHGGTSEGTLNTISAKDNVYDATSAYDFFIKQVGVDVNRIGICATSFSATLASEVSIERKVRSLIFRVPAAYTKEMMTMKMDKLLSDENRIFNQLAGLENTPIVQNISKFDGSLLVIASENDSLIPIRIPEVIISSAIMTKKKELKIMKGASHSLKTPEQSQEFTDLLIEWFYKNL